MHLFAAFIFYFLFYFFYHFYIVVLKLWVLHRFSSPKLSLRRVKTHIFRSCTCTKIIIYFFKNSFDFIIIDIYFQSYFFSFAFLSFFPLKSWSRRVTDNLQNFRYLILLQSVLSSERWRSWTTMPSLWRSSFKPKKKIVNYLFLFLYKLPLNSSAARMSSSFSLAMQMKEPIAIHSISL